MFARESVEEKRDVERIGLSRPSHSHDCPAFKRDETKATIAVFGKKIEAANALSSGPLAKAGDNGA